MYYPTMATIIYKKKKGREYAYWVRSARVDGKPRIVEQIYLGPKARFMSELKAAYTRGQSPGPVPLERVSHKEFGATAYLWRWAEELGLAEIVDRHVPPPGRRSTQLSVGQYLVIAALNRAIEPKSKRALYADWYKDSVLSRLWKAKESELTSQRFWDHMDRIEPEHIERIQRDVLARLAERFPLGGETILYDSTNFFTFIDTFNERTELAQRGNNKQKRSDLRQLSLALFEDRETALPIYHQCYAGNQHDARAFPEAREAFLSEWMGALDRTPEQLTLVFDGGNASKKNFQHLDSDAVHYVGGVPSGWLPDLLDVDRSEYRKLELPGTKHVKAHRVRRELWGGERTVLVVFSPALYRTQRKTMNREEARADERLRELAEKIDAWRESRRGKGHSEKSVRRKVRGWTAREHLREYLDIDLETDGERVARLSWTWDPERKRALQRRHLGKKMIATDRHEWDDVAIVRTYRRLTRTESLFKISKSDPGLWWPLFHWTDSKIRVHALYCYLALLLLAIMRIELREHGVRTPLGRAIDRLRNIDEAMVVYTNEAVDRVLTELDPEQRQLADALGIERLAEELGTTVL